MARHGFIKQQRIAPCAGAAPAATWKRFRAGAFAISILLVLFEGAAPAQVPQMLMDQGAAIIVFPKVLVDAGHDTLIQITNVGNAPLQARCFYTNTFGVPGTCASNPAQVCTADDVCAGGVCVRGKAVTEFAIHLLHQQPTIWVASQGRSTSNAVPGQLNNLIPASAAFQGYLLCVETTASQTPLHGNHLTGQATLTDTSTGDVAKYHAIGIQGDPNTFDNSNTLCLGGGQSADCPNGAQYSGCPATWLMDHLFEGATDSLIGVGSSVHTDLTVLPCTQDLSSAAPDPVVVQFSVINQLGQPFSTAQPFTGWTNTPLASYPIFSRAAAGTDYGQTQVVSTPGSGVLLVAQEFHDSGPPASLVSSAAMNLHVQGQRTGQDTIVLPPPPSPGFVPTTQPAGLTAITAGPDGNLWFTESSANQIGRIPPSGSPIAEFGVPTAGAAPAAIAKGPDDNLWFTEDGATQIGRVSTDGSVVKEFLIGAAANAITGGPDGNVWFTEPATNTIGRISTDGTTLNEFALDAQAPQPTSITAGPDGNLWFTQDGMFQTASAIGRITPDGSSITEFDIPTANSSPTSITPGPDGNLWFVETSAGRIGRITPAGVVSEFAAVAVPPLGFASLTSIASIEDGNLWFTTSGSGCVLGRITPAGVVTLFYKACGTSLTNGPDGNIWLLALQPERIVRFAP